ncbi:hypothetical protein KJ969_00515 [Patescibacteria group bacterium]|nr:hypothetical protein [Patescibacteria group bacterium]MBU1922476.1 hypothetical protein [Patescibacteria group bacterium]
MEKLTRAFFVFAMALCACGYGALLKYQTQRYADLDEHTLAVEPGMESGAFISLLKRAGASNIIHSKGYWYERVVSAITADFMDYIYFFEDEKYAGRMKIRYDEGYPQVHPFIKMVYLNGTYGAFLVAENMEIGGQRAAEIILQGDDSSPSYITISFAKKIKKYGGMYDPFIGGDNLADGVFLAARDNTGDVWPTAYKISFQEQKLQVEKAPLSQVAKCACFEKWMKGTDGREVFNMNVKKE